MKSSFEQFTLRINMNARPDIVYKSLATSSGLTSWFLRSANFLDSAGVIRNPDSFIQKGDSYSMLWHGYPDSVKQTGTVLEANGTDLFRFSFSLGCPVEIKLYTECGQTIAELTEGPFPEDHPDSIKHYFEDSKGWTFYLTNLKSVLEGGLDLRNKNREIKNVISA
jgi:hypothetical protein